MSSLPDVFRSIQSQYIRPEKQGGIYSIKYASKYKESFNEAEKVQPEEFRSMSIKWVKATESRAGTSHTIRSKITSMACTRNIVSSQSQRKGEFRKSYSRPSSQSIRRDIFANYGSSRVSFVIGETVPPSVEEAESLIHQLGQSQKQLKQCQQDLNTTMTISQSIAQSLKTLNLQINQQLNQIKQSTENELSRLHSLLSHLRRISGMQTKVNKTDIGEVQENLKIIAVVMDGIDEQSREMQEMCLK